MDFSSILFTGDIHAIDRKLTEQPSLANHGIALKNNPQAEHPLHRICDGVCNGDYSDDHAVEIAKVFVRHGASVNGPYIPGKDSPLTAACSLRSDKVALYYISLGADIDHQGCHGGTALHWASWCGRDVIVEKLLQLKPAINQRCIDFKSTPLFWALHGYRFGGAENLHHQVNCARLLLAHGADPTIPNFEGYTPKQLLREEDTPLIALFENLS
jgi:uncharacterized protein